MIARLADDTNFQSNLKYFFAFGPTIHLQNTVTFNIKFLVELGSKDTFQYSDIGNSIIFEI